MDDIDRASIANGRVLSYDSSTNKFVFISPGAASSLWSESISGDVYRNSNVGINSADPQVALDVVGDANITGVVTATSFYGDGSNLTGVSADTAVYATNAGIASYADVAGIATVAENLTGSPSIEVTNITASGVVTATAFTGEFVSNVDKTLDYYQSGSLSTVTSAVGTKTFYYDNVGVLTAIVGTGVYVSKEFTYDGDGNLISVNVL